MRHIPPRLFRWAINLWPPLLGARIRVEHVSPDFRRIQASLKLTRFNRNYWGSHYGGSLFSLTDPFYAIMLARALGHHYWVSDHSAKIVFHQADKGTVTAIFEINESVVEDIRTHTQSGEKHFVSFKTQVLNHTQQVVAEVERTLYIRLKKEFRPH